MVLTTELGKGLGLTKEDKKNVAEDYVIDTAKRKHMNDTPKFKE